MSSCYRERRVSSRVAVLIISERLLFRVFKDGHGQYHLVLSFMKNAGTFIEVQ